MATNHMSIRIDERKLIHIDVAHDGTEYDLCVGGAREACEIASLLIADSSVEFGCYGEDELLDPIRPLKPAYDGAALVIYANNNRIVCKNAQSLATLAHHLETAANCVGKPMDARYAVLTAAVAIAWPWSGSLEIVGAASTEPEPRDNEYVRLSAHDAAKVAELALWLEETVRDETEVTAE